MGTVIRPGVTASHELEAQISGVVSLCDAIIRNSLSSEEKSTSVALWSTKTDFKDTLQRVRKTMDKFRTEKFEAAPEIRGAQAGTVAFFFFSVPTSALI